MADPHVAVGLPVYNDPEGLWRTVPSVLNQTWSGDLRLLVVDEGSNDETQEVLRSLRALDDRIEVVLLGANKGRPFARNKIVELAGDGYLAWIDVGDLWHPRKLELQLDSLREAECEDSATPQLCACPARWVLDDREYQAIKVPEVDGDQLRNALLGTLPAHLPALIGRAEHFRAAGGFDERLLRRYDYDFLVRFVGGGGHVVTTSPDTPLLTHLTSDIGGSAAVVAAANRLIREKHRPHYRRYGLATTRKILSDQHRLVARFLRNDGKHGRARILQLRARMISLGGQTSPRRLRIIGRLGGLADSAARTLINAARPVLPWLHRWGVINFARRAGLTRLTARSARAGVITNELRSASAAGDADREIARLESAVASAGAPPTTWLRLEEAYRRQGLLYSAQTALERGLQIYPGNGALHVRLVELFPTRRAWRACIDLWALHDLASAPWVRALTFARVSWAYRELGMTAQAMTVTEEAMQRWPHENRLRNELYLCRSALLDWRGALVGADARSLDREEDKPIGVVTRLGFMAGLPGPVSGQLFVPTADPTVSLVLNGTQVATTSAAPGGEARQSFSLSCHDLMPFLGDGDVVTIEHDGSPLPIAGLGRRCEVRTGYGSRYAELRQALDNGYVFTKFGVLRKGHTQATKRQVLALYDEVADVLSDSHGYQAFPFYGNLLGAIRDHDFIPHDVGGFDMAYISRFQRPEDVRGEFLDICRSLLGHGYFLRLEPWSVYVKRRHGDQGFVDVNYGWFNEAGELQISYGSRNAPVRDRVKVMYPRTGVIAGHVVNVPGNAEDVLSQIYGPFWAIPDQGFGVDAGLERDARFILTIHEMVSFERLDRDRVDARIDEHPNFTVDRNTSPG